MLWENFLRNMQQLQRTTQMAVVADEAAISYADLARNAEAMAEVLTAAGVGKGQVLHAYLGNIPAFVVAQLATSKVGCVFAPLDVGLTDAEARDLLTLTGGDLIVCEVSSQARCEKISNNFIVVDALGQVVLCDIKHLPAPSVAEDIACIQFSSGSTGASKGILLSKEAFFYRSHYLLTSLGLREDDRTLCTLPLSHTHGAECLALPTLLAGGTLYLKSPKFAFPLYILEELERCGITFFSSIPQFYDFAVKLEHAKAPDLSALRHPFCGSAALARSTAEAFFARYGVHIKQGYGLAELSVICINRHEGARVVYDSIGTPLDGIEWRLSGDDNLSGDAMEGELIVRSKAMFSGYLNNPEQTQEKLQNGWLHTGDVVSVDADGLFRVIGRKEDFVKINGFKVYASEVERAIIGIDWVKECAVIAERNEVGAEFMVAYLVPADSDTVASVPVKEVIGFLRQRLSEYKIPKKFVLRTELPKNALGKILKSRIQGQP